MAYNNQGLLTPEEEAALDAVKSYKTGMMMYGVALYVTAVVNVGIHAAYWLAGLLTKVTPMITTMYVGFAVLYALAFVGTWFVRRHYSRTYFPVIRAPTGALF